MKNITETIINTVVTNNDNLAKQFTKSKKEIVKRCKKQGEVPLIKAYQEGVEKAFDVCTETINQLNDSLSKQIKEK